MVPRRTLPPSIPSFPRRSACRRVPGPPAVRRRGFAWLLVVLGGIWPAGDAWAIPFYARTRSLSCTDCHSVAPKLNVSGEEFLARGYRRSKSGGPETAGEFPVSVWITGRHEDRSPGGLNKTFVPKVELVSGGPIGDLMSYFLEWRVVSLDLRGEGTLRDRGGRFEDAFVNWEMADGHALRVGQFRSLNQYDVSLRLSVSEPAVFSTGLAGEPARTPRITALRAFAPSGRSPGVAYTYQSLGGVRASDGLFHVVNVPFVGELSLPLGNEARREASHELHGPAKGVFLETFYRRNLDSIGAHAFVDDNRWLLTGVGRLQRGQVHATAALGVDDAARRSRRPRYSLELEYFAPPLGGLTPALGFRVEQISRAGRDPAYIPYLALAGPQTHYTLLLQLEARFQGSARTVFVDLSAIF
jgi:hypothetical protein